MSYLASLIVHVHLTSYIASPHLHTFISSSFLASLELVVIIRLVGISRGEHAASIGGCTSALLALVLQREAVRGRRGGRRGEGVVRADIAEV